MGVCVLGALVAAWIGVSPWAAPSPDLLHAASPTTLSPRRLFNKGLAAEEEGDILGAVASYMAARLAPRTSFADTLYARGAGLRMIRVLAGRDDDAAAAVASVLASNGGARPGTDLSPLVRSLLARADQELRSVKGVLLSVHLLKEGGTRLVIAEEDGARHVVRAAAPVGPFSPGDPVRLLVRPQIEREATLVVLGRQGERGWRLMTLSWLTHRP